MLQQQIKISQTTEVSDPKGKTWVCAGCLFNEKSVFASIANIHSYFKPLPIALTGLEGAALSAGQIKLQSLCCCGTVEVS